MMHTVRGLGEDKNIDVTWHDGVIKVGDTITFEGVYPLRWWERALIWLRLMPKPAPPTPLQQFTVTWTS